MIYGEGGISHAGCPFRKNIDNKFLFFRSPSPHGGIGLNKRANITLDVLLLTVFFMERHAIRWRCQRVESSAYVLLRPTGETDK